MKTKQQLIDRVIEVLQADMNSGDFTVLEGLLSVIPTNQLIDSLDESEWVLYSKLTDEADEPTFCCTNCGGGFTRDEMVFDEDNENDFCKDCAK